MIEHESDLWPERRWAISTSDPSKPVRAFPFRAEYERKIWIAMNPDTRRAVGKRYYAVKHLRQQWKHEALQKLAGWKARHAP